MQLLTDDYARLSQSNAAAPAKNRSLFSLVNKEADRLSLSRRIEALRPAAARKTTAPNASRCASPAST